MEIVLLGDQLAECQQFLRIIFSFKDNLILNSLLDRVVFTLHQEILNQSDKFHPGRFPRFASVKELFDWYCRSGRRDPALESTFLCLAQVSHFVWCVLVLSLLSSVVLISYSYFEERNETYLHTYSDSQGPHILGACTGLLGASAIASADSLTTLLPLAVETIRIAFRTGLYIGDVAERLDGRSEEVGSWSTIVATSDKTAAEDAMDAYNEERGSALSSKLWISAFSPSSVTITGPPSKRRRLFSGSDYYSKTKHVDIGIYGPYHAAHINASSDVSDIIDDQTRQVFGDATLRYPVYSSVTAEPISASSPIELLETCLQEILRAPLRWDLLSERFGIGIEKCHIYAFGPTELADNLSATMKKGGIEVSKNDHSSWLARRLADPPKQFKYPNSDIAIVGMAGRFPDAAGLEQYWDLIVRGLDVHREVPPDRFNVKTHTDPSSKKKNTSHTPFGNFIENPGLFDARFFNMSPREANQTDPMQRLELVTAYEAMEMAGIVPGRTNSTKPDRIGTFYGMTSDDWREINAAQDIDTYFISGGVRAFGAGRINYNMKFSGPSFVVDTACSSSFAALQLACTTLRQGECDTAFSGGANVLTNPDIFSGLSRGFFLSKTGNCKTFDDEADGYCRGDGVASVILKRMEDAIADKDPILGVIRASATNHSAEAVSITHPHAGAQKFLFDKILRETDTNPHDVQYVEMHGTGTQAGDGIEMDSVGTIFAPSHPRRSPSKPLYLGSVKSNIGHGEAVSGVCALIKVLLMLQRNTIPPHCGIKGVMNKKFPTDLKDRNINIAFQETPFPRPPGGHRTVFINNFSAAGGNTAVLLEDAPERKAITIRDPRTVHVVNFSAKSLASFRKNLKLLRAYIDGSEDLDLASVAYTSTARRLHYSYRASFAVTSINDLSSRLSALEGKGGAPISPDPLQIAFVFTGQGSQYVNLGKQLYQSSKQFSSELDTFDKLAQAQGFPSFMTLVDSSEELNSLSPVVVQLGMACVQMALSRLWTSWGFEPTAVIGHSLGEYAALYAAGVLSASDTIYLVGTRATQLELKCTKDTHAMLAVKTSPIKVQDSLRDTNVEIACINSDAETVVSGELSDIDSVSKKLRSQNIDFKKLDVTFAYHSSQMDPAVASYQAAAEVVTFNTPKVSVLSPLLSTVVRKSGVMNAPYLARHCREKVDFRGALAAGVREGVIDEKTMWIEVGAHPICSGMVKACVGSSVATVPSLRRGEDSWKTIASSLSALSLAGANPNWSAYHQEYEASVECLPFPTYSFDEKNHWIQYVNDWTLTKGDPVRTAIQAPPVPKFSTTSIQKITSEDIQKDTATVSAESDIADPALLKTISGHAVNGVGLCPSSLYADMAMTLTQYAYKQLRPNDKALDMNVRNMENPASMLVRDIQNPSHQIMTIKTAVDVRRQEAKVTISSKPNGKTDTVHAKCIVSFEDPSQWNSEWERKAFLVRTRVDHLHDNLKAGKTHRLPRGVVYRLFGSLVDYSDKYRGMKEVVVDDSNHEATADLDFQVKPEDGSFTLAPFTIDSVGHLAGFTMNGSGGLDAKNQVFISHGWESMRLPTTLQAGKSYHSWVKMQPYDGGKVYAGDVYLFDDTAKIIGLIEGLKFQAIPRRVLNTFIPPAGAAAAKAAPPAQKPTQISTPKEPPKEIKKKVVVQSPKAAPSNNTIDQALGIIALEVGVDIAELADPIQLSDLGVDSLMTLTIAGRLREELDLEVDNDVMAEVPTIGHLKKYLISHMPDSAPVEAESDDQSSDSETELSTGVTTPDTSSDQSKEPMMGGTTSEVDEVISVIRTTIAEQMDIDIEEITDNLDLSDMGMDSLMALTVLGSLREVTGVEYDPELFADNNTLAAVRKALSPAAPPPAAPKAAPKAAPPPPEPKPAPEPTKSLTTRKVLASSILLQGNTKTATKRLFLLPDGSGSPTSYSSIPPLAPSKVCVYGLTCPFLKEPTTFTCGVEGVVKIYIEEIIRRQPEGPYLIGGWSAGGVFAFEATRQFSALQKANPSKNYKVEQLLLLDSPCPYALEPLPTRLHVFFNEIGLLGDGNPANTPKWLLPHFQASIDALKAYQPVLIENDPYEAPPTFLIWCTDGVAKYPDSPRPPPQDDDPKSMKWLLNNRTDFGPNGWDKLVGKGNCTCVVMGGNHFTMMKEPLVSFPKLPTSHPSR